MNDLHAFLAQHVLWFAVGYLLASIVGLATMGLDKSRARRGQWRVPENTLLWIAVVGGAAGVFLGVRLFHHKTRHAKFTVTVPLLLVIQLATLLYLLVS